MKKHFYFIAISLAFIGLNSCKKDSAEPPFDNVFSKPYSTGIIKFQYQTKTAKDTTISFASIGNNLSEKDDYGYSKPSTPWVQLMRLNPNNFQNRAIIFFDGTNLDSLALPYKFKAGDIQNAQINYIADSKPIYDNTGNYTYNTYAATTYANDFELTVLSRVNNRLQGTYNGIIKNQDGLTLNIEKGLFDIIIVNK